MEPLLQKETDPRGKEEEGKQDTGYDSDPDNEKWRARCVQQLADRRNMKPWYVCARLVHGYEVDASHIYRRMFELEKELLDDGNWQQAQWADRFSACFTSSPDETKAHAAAPPPPAITTTTASAATPLPAMAAFESLNETERLGFFDRLEERIYQMVYRRDYWNEAGAELAGGHFFFHYRNNELYEGAQVFCGFQDGRSPHGDPSVHVLPAGPGGRNNWCDVLSYEPTLPVSKMLTLMVQLLHLPDGTTPRPMMTVQVEPPVYVHGDFECVPAFN